MAEAAVRLDGVSKRFGPSVALDKAWLKIERGEFMTLLGPSGCGKTTLLNLVAGFLTPNEGEIFIDGALVTDVPAFARQTGIVFQNYALFPHMTVANNVAYGLKARGVAKDEIRKRVADHPGDDEALRIRRPASLANCRAVSSSGSHWRARW